MAIIKNAITFGSGFNITAQGPIDSRSRVETKNDLLTIWGVDAPAYVGMVVSVIETGTLFVLTAADYTNIKNWVEIGSGSGSTTAEKYSAAKAMATADNIGQLIYVLNDETISQEGSDVVYQSGPYVVSGVNEISKLGTSSATGDLQSDVTSLKGDVANLKSTVDVSVDSGLRKDASSKLAVKLDPVEGNALKVTNAGLKVEIPEVTIPEYSVKALSTPENGYLKSYALTKDGVEVEGAAKINIPKDLVVTGGEVITVASPDEFEGAVVGKLYLKITIANQETPVYIPVDELVDVYTADEVYIKLTNGKFSLDTDKVKDLVGTVQADLVTKVNTLTTDVKNLETGKVDVVEGKGLSTNDFTDALKTKLDAVEEGAQVNVIESIKLGETEVAVENKVAKIDLTATLEPYAKTTDLDSKLNSNATVNGVAFANNAVVIDSSKINLQANIGEENDEDKYTTDDSIQTVLADLHNRIKVVAKAAQDANGVKSVIAANNSLNVDAADPANVKVAVKLNEATALKLTETGLGVVWESLSDN